MNDKELAMSTIHSSPLLRQALVADATTSAAFGLLMLIGAGPLSGILGLPEMLLRKREARTSSIRTHSSAPTSRMTNVLDMESVAAPGRVRQD